MRNFLMTIAGGIVYFYYSMFYDCGGHMCGDSDHGPVPY